MVRLAYAEMLPDAWGYHKESKPCKDSVYSVTQSNSERSPAQHSTAQHGTARHSTSMAQHSTAQHAQHSAAQLSTAQQTQVGMAA